MKTKLIWAGIVIAIAIGVIALVGGNQSVSRTVGALNSGAQTVLDGLTVTNKNQGQFIENGLSTVVSSGNLTSGTTTMVSVLNPFGATSTVDFTSIQATFAGNTAATVACGTTTNANLGAVPGGTLISSLVATGTTQAYMVNGVSYGATSGQNGNGNNRIDVGPTERVACTVSYNSSTTAATSTSGTYDFRWNN
jgi:hypothetical protein